jgi:cytochrome b561
LTDTIVNVSGDAKVSTPLTYKPAARALHWIVFLLILAMIPVGQIMLQEGLARPTQNALFMFHKNVGVAVIFLVLLRIAYRAFNPPPPLPATVPAIQRRLGGLVHLALYALLLVMAVSGYVRVVAGGFPLEFWDAIGLPRVVPRSDALAETAKQIHNIARFPLVGLILLHVGAALFHGLVKRDGVLSRMLPSTGR